MVFKVVAGISHDAEAIWSGDSAQNVAKTSIMNVNSSDKRYFKGRRIGYWEKLLKPKEVNIKDMISEDDDSSTIVLVIRAIQNFSSARVAQDTWATRVQNSFKIRMRKS